METYVPFGTAPQGTRLREISLGVAPQFCQNEVMRSLYALVAAVVIAVAGAAPAAQEPTITKQMALRAVTLFREADPTSKEALGCAGLAIRYVEKDRRMHFIINDRNVPFPTTKSLSENQRLALLGAYMVGNLHSCLLREDRVDDPYAGDLQVIQTYRQMQQKNPQLRVPEIEKMIEMERRGELKRYVSRR